MGLDQKGSLVFSVSRGKNSQWDVREADFAEPLASFDSEDDATTYANDLAKTKQGSKVVVKGRAA